MSQVGRRQSGRDGSPVESVEDSIAPIVPAPFRRRILVTAVATTAIIGAGWAAWPFLASLRISAKARSLGGPVVIDAGKIEPGAQVTVAWRGKPIWVLRRTPAMLERLNRENWLRRLRDPSSNVASQQPPYARNATRSLKPEIFVAVALCTHLGCVPTYLPQVAADGLGEEWMGGYFCPCHGSKFDLAGRVFKNVPAPTNLLVPPYRYLGDDILEIGVDHATA